MDVIFLFQGNRNKFPDENEREEKRKLVNFFLRRLSPCRRVIKYKNYFFSSLVKIRLPGRCPEKEYLWNKWVLLMKHQCSIFFIHMFSYSLSLFCAGECDLNEMPFYVPLSLFRVSHFYFNLWFFVYDTLNKLITQHKSKMIPFPELHKVKRINKSWRRHKTHDDDLLSHFDFFSFFF